MSHLAKSAIAWVVKDFWDEAACGERLYLEGETARGYSRQSEIRYALEHPQQYRFVSIKDLDLSERLPDGQPVYESLDLPLQRSSWNNATRSVETVCTKGLLVAAWDKLPDAQKKMLKQILDFEWMRIYATGR